jgi:hypothetical protein
MSIKNRLDRLHKKTSIEENIVKLMEYFHWSLEDIKAMTVPQYMVILDTLNQIEKKKPKTKQSGR